MKLSGKDPRNVKLHAAGKAVGVWLTPGPWVAGATCHPEAIKMRPKRNYFPEAFVAELTIENNSDAQVDYFESDCVTLEPDHPLYTQAKEILA